MNNFAEMQIRRYFSWLSFVLGLIFVTGFVVPLQAQQTTVLQEVQKMNLRSDKGKITVYYASGYEKRAADVRSLVEEMVSFYEKKLALKEDFSVAILTEEQWAKYTPKYLPVLPYGLPFVEENVAFLPADNKGAVTVGAMALIASVLPATLKKIKQSGYDFDEGAMKFTDLIGLHELGHVYTVAYGIKPSNKWFNEFLASYFAYAFLREKHPKLAKLMQAMATDVYNNAIKPEHTSFADFERLYLGVGVANYGWYQGKFVEKGAQIYDTQKLSFLADVKKAFPAEEKEKVSEETTLERLEKISPGITQWSNNLK